MTRALAVIFAILLAFILVSATSGSLSPREIGQQEDTASAGMTDETAMHPHAEHGSSHQKADHSHDVPALQSYSFDLAAFPSRRVWDGGALFLSGENRSKLKRPPRISSNSDVQQNIRLENYGNAALLSG